MTVFIAVICICAWLVGAAVKYRLEELQNNFYDSSADRHKRYWGRFDAKPTIWFHFVVSWAICLAISSVMQVYIGSWDYLGIMSWKVVLFSILNGEFTAFLPLWPSSIVGALLYVFHTGRKSGLYRKACWWLLATYPLEKILTDSVGYGVVQSFSELNSVPKGLPDSDFLGILGVAIFFVIIPVFVAVLAVAALLESGIFWGLVYALRPSKKPAGVVSPQKAHRHKRKRRF